MNDNAIFLSVNTIFEISKSFFASVENFIGYKAFSDDTLFGEQRDGQEKRVFSHHRETFFRLVFSCPEGSPLPHGLMIFNEKNGIPFSFIPAKKNAF